MALPELEELERIVGHRFGRRDLLASAVTHSSAAGDGVQPPASDNERLEFLGDAVLELVVSDYLLSAFPQWTEGHLSRGRAQLVNTVSIGLAAQRLGLGEHLRLGKGEEKSGGREKTALLAGVFEAVVGAIYLDAGLSPAREFVTNALLVPELDARADRLGRGDYKSELQELLQKNCWPPAHYTVVRESGPDHRKVFMVEVTVPGRVTAGGSGTSKKEAEQIAAQRALEQMGAVTAGQLHG